MSMNPITDVPLSSSLEPSPHNEAVREKAPDKNDANDEAALHVAENVDTESTESTGRKINGFRWFLVVIAVLSPTFLYALDNTIMANVRPSIIDTLGQLGMITWLTVSYPMGELGANPLWYVISIPIRVASTS